MTPSHAFADESARGPRYLVCAVVAAENDVKSLRQLATGMCLPGQRRWHFAKERGSRRRQILEVLVASFKARAVITTGKGDEAAVRRACFRTLAAELPKLGVARLVIESREGRDHEDRRVLGETLPRHGSLQYLHARPTEDPCLWFADAVAWAYGAGGQWPERIRPLMPQMHDLGVVTD